MVTTSEGPPGLMCVGFNLPFNTITRPPAQTHDLVASRAPRCWMNTITLSTVHNGQEPVSTVTFYIKSAGVLFPIASRRVAVTVGLEFIVSTLRPYKEYDG